MTVQIGTLHKKRIVKDLSGNIIDWFDEVNGGWIIKDRAIINHKRWEEEQKKIKDKIEASKAQSLMRNNPAVNSEMSEVPATSKKIKEMENDIKDIKDNLNTLIEIIKNKNE